eukprot:TRINITY_DN5986_c0_g2_i1.p1 TRINITY_DN5986_c0_g2~~TRINITY_DN5986_c0_g2_i1.p1  ORF type:complete len:207 (+),score=37.16 TRINITY_DN5986_c0_g2_i1:432-1052(+)
MTQLDFLTRKALKTELIQYMEQGDWRKVLEFYEEKDQYREPLLVWIRPNVEILKFLESELLFRGLKEILSIGCGCGFLEWLINASTELSVSGLEVNESWWRGPHSTPQYIPLKFTSPGEIPELNPEAALLFCYFNSSEYFLQYVEQYSGPLIILIGPVDGFRHCDPEPGYLRTFPSWRSVSVKNIVNGEERDQIAIYVRKIGRAKD